VRLGINKRILIFGKEKIIEEEIYFFNLIQIKVKNTCAYVINFTICVKFLLFILAI